MPRHWAGVDGCRQGWIVVVIDNHWRPRAAHVRQTFAEIVRDTTEAELTLVDIPIGLPSKLKRQDRTCDAIARRLLKPRASRVFSVPSREAVFASDYTSACNKNHKILGKRLSKQSWAICHKIREVDSLLRTKTSVRRRVRETHPELCFRFLNKGIPLVESKKTKEGQQLRTRLLARYISEADRFMFVTKNKYPSSWLGIDDILDATAAAVIARLASRGKVFSLPRGGERDEYGLPMEMVGIDANPSRP